MVESHITGNIIQLGKHFYRQFTGIPQGSALSPALCRLVVQSFRLLQLKGWYPGTPWNIDPMPISDLQALLQRHGRQSSCGPNQMRRQCKLVRGRVLALEHYDEKPYPNTFLDLHILKHRHCFVQQMTFCSSARTRTTLSLSLKECQEAYLSTIALSTRTRRSPTFPMYLVTGLQWRRVRMVVRLQGLKYLWYSKVVMCMYGL